jgi:hypothetical protein
LPRASDGAAPAYDIMVSTGDLSAMPIMRRCYFRPELRSARRVRYRAAVQRKPQLRHRGRRGDVSRLEPLIV